LILTVKQAAIDLNNTHSATAGFENVNATIQAKRFLVWAYTVFKDYIEEASFEIEPDNDNLHYRLMQSARNMTINLIHNLEIPWGFHPGLSCIA
jgi:hypothetical protein